MTHAPLETGQHPVLVLATLLVILRVTLVMVMVMEALGNAEQHLNLPTAFGALNLLMALVLLVLMEAIKAVELWRLALVALSALVAMLVLVAQEALMVLVAA